MTVPFVMSKYRDDAKTMLKRWGCEVRRGASKNVLDIENGLGRGQVQGGWPPGGAGMFSPLAAKCDVLMHELLLIDPEDCRYLIAFAIDISMQKLADQLKVSKSKVQIDLDGALSAFAMMLYCRTGNGCTREECPFAA